MAHIHAELMKQYAEDAAKFDEPWKNWEFRTSRSQFEGMRHHPQWDVDCEYRRKIKTYKLGDKFVRSEKDSAYHGELFILGLMDDKVALIALSDGFQWCKGKSVSDFENITESEFEDITSGLNGFDLVEIEIKVKD